MKTWGFFLFGILALGLIGFSQETFAMSAGDADLPAVDLAGEEQFSNSVFIEYTVEYGNESGPIQQDFVITPQTRSPHYEKITVGVNSPEITGWHKSAFKTFDGQNPIDTSENPSYPRIVAWGDWMNGAILFEDGTYCNLDHGELTVTCGDVTITKSANGATNISGGTTADPVFSPTHMRIDFEFSGKPQKPGDTFTIISDVQFFPGIHGDVLFLINGYPTSSTTPSASDSDGDGIIDISDNCHLISNPDQLDFDEDTFGDKCDTDVDNDGVENDFDICPRSDDNVDNDLDGIPNGCDNLNNELCGAGTIADNNLEQCVADSSITCGTGTTLVNNQCVVETTSTDTTTDSDGDGLSDYQELNQMSTICIQSCLPTDPLNPDSDGDGLSDGNEALIFDTDPNIVDTDSDSDGLPNMYEAYQTSTDSMSLDTDGDGLGDGDEVLLHDTDPNVRDTDFDGKSDGDEITTGTDPLVADIIQRSIIADFTGDYDGTGPSCKMFGLWDSSTLTCTINIENHLEFNYKLPWILHVPVGHTLVINADQMICPDCTIDNKGTILIASLDRPVNLRNAGEIINSGTINTDCEGMITGIITGQPSVDICDIDGAEQAAAELVSADTVQCSIGDSDSCTTACGGTDGSRICSTDSTWGICTPPAEVLNGEDDDCDGVMDNGFIYDNDQDGYYTIDAGGYLPEPDCNDNDNAIYPGAAEIANDGIDQDCDDSDLITETQSTNVADMDLTISHSFDPLTNLINFDFNVINNGPATVGPISNDGVLFFPALTLLNNPQRDGMYTTLQSCDVTGENLACFSGPDPNGDPAKWEFQIGYVDNFDGFSQGESFTVTASTLVSDISVDNLEFIACIRDASGFTTDPDIGVSLLSTLADCQRFSIDAPTDADFDAGPTPTYETQHEQIFCKQMTIPELVKSGLYNVIDNSNSKSSQILDGTNGADLFIASMYGDTFNGLAGHDCIIGGPGNDVLHGNGGVDAIFGQAGNDSLHGRNGNDFVWGESGNDTIMGYLGNDHLRGGDGNDTLLGGVGDDNMQGQEGDDKLDGQVGNDLMNGNAGTDTCIFDSNDLIKPVDCKIVTPEPELDALTSDLPIQTDKTKYDVGSEVFYSGKIPDVKGSMNIQVDLLDDRGNSEMDNNHNIDSSGIFDGSFQMKEGGRWNGNFEIMVTTENYDNYATAFCVYDLMRDVYCDSSTSAEGGKLDSAMTVDIMNSNGNISTEALPTYSQSSKSTGTFLSEINSGKVCGLSLCSEQLSIEKRIDLYLQAISSE